MSAAIRSGASEVERAHCVPIEDECKIGGLIRGRAAETVGIGCGS